MCGRFANQVPDMPAWSELLKIWPDIQKSFNVSPGQTVTAFRTPAGKAMRWGLIPHWSDEFSSEFATHNARLESISEKPAFRDAWQNSQRCLIPMLGYYEWKGSRGKKQPYFVQAKDGKGLVVAGLYDSWGSDKLYSCTILTRPANESMRFLHARMPVLLTPQSAEQWLHIDRQDAQEFLMQSAAPELEIYPVTKDVGNVLANGRRLTEKIDIENTD